MGVREGSLGNLLNVLGIYWRYVAQALPSVRLLAYWWLAHAPDGRETRQLLKKKSADACKLARRIYQRVCQTDRLSESALQKQDETLERLQKRSPLG